MAKDPKSLLVVIGSLDRGGCETHLLQILPLLVAKKYLVEIFLLSSRGALTQEMEEKGVKLIFPWVSSDPKISKSVFFRILQLAAVSLQLYLHLLLKRPKIIHFFLPASYLIGGIVSLFAGRFKRVMSRRSLNLYMKDKSYIVWLEKTLHKRMDAVLGNSAAVVAQLVTEEDAPSQHVTLIYNGVATDKPLLKNRPVFREALGVKSSEITVITVVANLIPYKGHMDLLEALALLNNMNVVVILAGRDDGYGAMLRKRCEDLELSKQVIFLGAYRNVPDLLQASDLFVLPSHEEGFSNALLEAMAAGLPIVATDVGGNGEAIQHENSGLIVPSNDPHALSQAIKNLLDNPEQAQKFAKNAAKRAQEEYSIDRCCEKYDELYVSL